jgi:hypothetical protein
MLEPLDTPSQPRRRQVGVDGDFGGHYVGQRTGAAFIAQHERIQAGFHLGDGEIRPRGHEVAVVPLVQCNLREANGMSIAQPPPSLGLGLAHRVLKPREVEARQEIGRECTAGDGPLGDLPCSKHDVYPHLDRVPHREMRVLQVDRRPPTSSGRRALLEDRCDEDQSAQNAQSPKHDASSSRVSGRDGDRGRSVRSGGPGGGHLVPADPQQGPEDRSRQKHQGPGAACWRRSLPR